MFNKFNIDKIFTEVEDDLTIKNCIKLLIYRKS